MKNTLWKVINLILPLDVFEGMDWKVLYDNILVDGLQLWCLNFAVLLSLILASPFIIGDFSRYPEFFYSLLTVWFVDGFKIHLIIYAFCVLISADERYK